MEDYFTCHAKEILKNGCTHFIFNFFLFLFPFFFLKGNKSRIQERGYAERSNPMLCSTPLCVALSEELNWLDSDGPSQALGGCAQVKLS